VSKARGKYSKQASVFSDAANVSVAKRINQIREYLLSYVDQNV
jgi:hypothetical protein